MKKSDKKWGFLAPSREKAKEMEAKYKEHFTPLIDYMKVIFPNIDDWEEEKEIDLTNNIHIKPDLFSKKGKKIIQLVTKKKALDFDKKDVIKCGYDVYTFLNARQLTNATVKQIFGVDVIEHLFDEDTPTLTQPWFNYKSDLSSNLWRNVKRFYYGDIKQSNLGTALFIRI